VREAGLDWRTKFSVRILLTYSFQSPKEGGWTGGGLSNEFPNLEWLWIAGNQPLLQP